jgi:hypothetical protein
LEKYVASGQFYAYRVDCGGKSIEYATNAEYKKLGSGDLKPAIEFFKDADLLIFDSISSSIIRQLGIWILDLYS